MSHVAEREINHFFKGGKPTSLNACVGNNGFQDINSYYRGYIEIAKTMMDNILEKRELQYKIDDLIYPIGFCIRHAVELCLKDSIISLNHIRENQHIKNLRLSKYHDIKALWDIFLEQSKKTDRRYQDITERLSPYIHEISKIDATGQTFRYPENITNVKHLTAHPVINILTLRNNFEELEKLMDELVFANHVLIDEYRQNTYTTTLSRYDLYCIAKSLPPKSRWGEERMKAISNDIKSQYELSGKKFSKALNIIQNHYELSNLIDIQLPLINATCEDIKHFIEQHQIYYKSEKETGGFSPLSIENIFEDFELERSCVEACIEHISTPSLADIFSIYNIGRETLYPIYTESYQNAQETILQELIFAEREENLEESISHYLTKTNVGIKLILGLSLMGQKSIVEEIKKAFPELLTIEEGDISRNYPYPLVV